MGESGVSWDDNDFEAISVLGMMLALPECNCVCVCLCVSVSLSVCVSVCVRSWGVCTMATLTST